MRARATIGGNVANGSPAADLALCLLVLDASVEAVSVRGTRVIPLRAFFQGPKLTALADDELIRRILVPPHDPSARGWFAKVGPRARHFISRVALAGLFVPRSPSVDLRIGLGAVAPTPIRAWDAERYAASCVTLGPSQRRTIVELARRACCPIDDVRASAAYRCAVAEVLVDRFLTEVVG